MLDRIRATARLWLRATLSLGCFGTSCEQEFPLVESVYRPRVVTIAWLITIPQHIRIGMQLRELVSFRQRHIPL